MIKKIGATSILSTITLGGIWQVYSALDSRVRATEIDLKGSIVTLENLREDVTEIKSDVKIIKEIMIKERSNE